MPFLQNHTDYDVVIVGAGPAGGQLARELAAAGKHVLLTERFSDFSKNNYSSGACPIEVMEEFQLPDHLMHTLCQRFCLFSPSKSHEWRSENPYGVILDFKKLKTFLADQTVRYGSCFQPGFCYLRHEKIEGMCRVTFKDANTSSTHEVTTKILVDASGSDRVVLSKRKPKGHFLQACGIEVHLKVCPSIAKTYQKALSFYLGSRWMPGGYAWVFPMNEETLKIGVIRYGKANHEVNLNQSLDEMIYKIVGGHALEIEKHGKTLLYHYGQKDIKYDGEIIAMGDAISMLNPLGCEGIRHALVNARIASIHIQKRLEGLSSNWKGYREDISNYVGWKWFFCEKIMKKIYFTSSDRSIDLAFSLLRKMTHQELMEAVFSYKVTLLGKFFCKQIALSLYQKVFFWKK